MVCTVFQVFYCTLDDGIFSLLPHGTCGQGKCPKRTFPLLCLIPFRSLLLTESQLISFPLATMMFHHCTRHARQAWIRFPDWKPMDHRRYLPMSFRLWKRPSFSMPRHPSNAFLSML
ncbi:hypothetical protein KP509_27G056700 [Ceratopteris richardii]|uniref:Uncharacterized protein n=1 Tax=Ceratopteris richardii TaxID=49495 RepID=A0A8T2RIP8_CERRI|nr:hypothetical protein KP509_27G056700 [Ceratopteris richardii]